MANNTRNTILVAVGKIALNLGGIAIAMGLSRLLTKGEYAAYRQTAMVLGLTIAFFRLGLSDSLLYFLPREPGRCRTIWLANTLLQVSSGLGWCAFVLLGGNVLLGSWIGGPDLPSLILLTAPMVVLMFPSSQATAVLTALNKADRLVTYNVLSQLAVVVGVLAVCFFVPDPWYAVFAQVGLTSIAAVWGVGLCFFACDSWQGWPDRSEFLRQLKLSLPLWLSICITVSLQAVDQLLVSVMCSAESFAIYVNGAIEIPFVSSLALSAGAVLTVSMSQTMAKGSGADAIALWKRATTKAAHFVLPVACFCFVMAPEIMSVLFSEKYMASVTPFRIYLVALPLSVLFFPAAIIAVNKGHLLVTAAALALAAKVVVGVPMIYWFGYSGAAWGTVVMKFCCYVPFLTFQMAKIYGVRVRDLFYLKSLLTTSVLNCIISAAVVVVVLPQRGYSPIVLLAVSGAIYGAGLLTLDREFWWTHLKIVAHEVVYRFGPKKVQSG